jgi:hypothetical protein
LKCESEGVHCIRMLLTSWAVIKVRVDLLWIFLLSTIVLSRKSRTCWTEEWPCRWSYCMASWALSRIFAWSLFYYILWLIYNKIYQMRCWFFLSHFWDILCIFIAIEICIYCKLKCGAFCCRSTCAALSQIF